jgi:hypothetical protein
MKRFLALALLVALTAVSVTSFAATTYVITNDNNEGGNTATVYRLNKGTGALKQTGVLRTGGFGTPDTNPANVSQAITEDGGCVFIFDVGSSDIAAFSAATEYSKVGNYSSPALGSAPGGGSLALTPSGGFLYATYNGTMNVGAWAVNSDCSLGFIGAYSPSGGTSGFALKVSPDGKYVVTAGVGFEGAELFSIDQTTGALTDINYLTYSNAGTCAQIGCYPSGVDITKDSRVVVFGGEGSLSTALFAEITANGLVGPRVALLKNSLGIGEPNCPFFSAAGYRGSGDLYVGMGGGPPTGLLTALVNEKPPSLVVRNATVTGGSHFQGVIAVTGNLMITALYPNQIGVFSINGDGSLTQVNLITDPNAVALTSLSVFPSVR